MSGQPSIVEAFRVMTANRSLSDEELHDLIRDGITAALTRHFNGPVEAEITILPDGDIKIVALKEVVEVVEESSCQITLKDARYDDPDFQLGDLLEIPVQFSDFGRNAVIVAKQRIVQRLREGERERIREEFSGSIGDLVSGEVQQIERGKIVVMLNRARQAEAVIPWREQNPRERFRQGEAIRAVLKKLEETPRGPRLILSRGDPAFVAALFAIEVPEIYQGIVEIKEIVREAGGRTKIAVSSRDESIDPVGACVGLRGSRVQAVVSELSGERIDIVPWHPDPDVFAKRALAPARVAKVISDPERHVITAIVDEDQLSLAIGRNGQNVRLASQLIGWQLDLYSSRDWLARGAETSLFGGGEEEEVADFPLAELDGMTPTTLVALEAAGVNTFFEVLEMEREDFVKIPGIDDADADSLVALIDELTVVDEPAEEASETAGEAAGESVEDSVEEAAGESVEEAVEEAAEESVEDSAEKVEPFESAETADQPSSETVGVASDPEEASGSSA